VLSLKHGGYLQSGKDEVIGLTVHGLHRTMVFVLWYMMISIYAGFSHSAPTIICSNGAWCLDEDKTKEN
jgi:hypothetical protein